MKTGQIGENGQIDENGSNWGIQVFKWLLKRWILMAKNMYIKCRPYFFIAYKTFFKEGFGAGSPIPPFSNHCCE